MNHSVDNARGRADLLVSEARRSLSVFAASLRQRDGFLQASLHSKDLSVVLMSLGQTGPSEVFSELSRQLALRNTAAVPVAERFAAAVAEILSAMASGTDIADDAGHEDWVDWIGKVRGGLADEELIKTFGESRPESPLPETAEIAADTPNDRIRSQALRLLQEARALNFRDDERTVLRLDAVLSELQDWMLRPLQHRLSDLFEFVTIHGGEIGVDPIQGQRLTELDTIVRRAREVRATYRSLLVFLDLRGLVLSTEESAHAGRVAAELGGRVQRTEEGYRFVLPTSLDRQRVTPFFSAGRPWVISNAQLLTFRPAESADAVGCLDTVFGDTPVQVPVERVLPSENMNLTSLSRGLDVPSSVERVAVNGRDETFWVWPHPRPV